MLLSADADAGFDTQALVRQAIINMLKQHWSAAAEATSSQTNPEEALSLVTIDWALASCDIHHLWMVCCLALTLPDCLPIHVQSSILPVGNLLALDEQALLRLLLEALLGMPTESRCFAAIRTTEAVLGQDELRSVAG